MESLRESTILVVGMNRSKRYRERAPYGYPLAVSVVLSREHMGYCLEI